MFERSYGGSWVVISGVLSPLIWVLSIPIVSIVVPFGGYLLGSLV